MNRTAALALAIMIAAGPGLPQLLDIDLPIFRPWRMYSTVALGSAFGNFEIQSPAGSKRNVPLTKALGLSRYREQQIYPGSGDVILNLALPGALTKTASPICRHLQTGETLAFNGRIAFRHHWKKVALNDEELCGAGR